MISMAVVMIVAAVTMVGLVSALAGNIYWKKKLERKRERKSFKSLSSLTAYPGYQKLY